MDNGIGHTVAMLAAIAVVALVAAIHHKIQNPSPPPPEGAPDERGEQGKRGNDSTGPRGDVDHVQSSNYIPPEEPDIIQASRVGWHETDPEQPTRTHIHWVPRAEWEAAQDDDRRPGWLKALWP